MDFENNNNNIKCDVKLEENAFWFDGKTELKCESEDRKEFYGDGRHWSNPSGLLPASGRAFDFYDVVVHPKLRGGHEGELVQWLKEENLLKSGVQCKNPQCNNRWTNWTSQCRVTDKFIWQCANCLDKFVIRDSSFFFKIKCELKVVMQVLMGWCKNMPFELLSQRIRHDHGLIVKQDIIKRIYTRCSEVTSCHMLEYGMKWQLGGLNSLVLVDTYPDGYMAPPLPNLETGPVKKKAKHQQQYILCLADLSMLPPLTWLQIVKPDLSSEKPTKASSAAVKGLVEDALLVLRRHVRPGTALVGNYKSRCCSVEALREIPGYTSVTSVENLTTLDTMGKRCIRDNLETIWQNVVSVCESIQDDHMNDRQATIALHEHMWRHKFGENAFEKLIRHISEQYRF